MANQSRIPGEPPFPVPEIAPQLVPDPDIGRKPETPIEVIDGALEEIRRRERDEEGGDGERERKPTIH